MGQAHRAPHMWTARDETNLKELADECMPAPLLGLKLGCSEAEVYAKASEMGVGIAPDWRPPTMTHER